MKGMVTHTMWSQKVVPRGSRIAPIYHPGLMPWALLMSIQREHGGVIYGEYGLDEF